MGAFEALLTIQVIMTMLIDVTGVVDHLFTPLAKRITGAKVGRIGPPLSCSLCMTFWTGLVWLLITGHFGLVNLMLLLLLACTTRITLSLFHLVTDFIEKMVGTIYDFFNL